MTKIAAPGEGAAIFFNVDFNVNNAIAIGEGLASGSVAAGGTAGTANVETGAGCAADADDTLELEFGRLDRGSDVCLFHKSYICRKSNNTLTKTKTKTILVRENTLNHAK